MLVPQARSIGSTPSTGEQIIRSGREVTYGIGEFLNRLKSILVEGVARPADHGSELARRLNPIEIILATESDEDPSAEG